MTSVTERPVSNPEPPKRPTASRRIPPPRPEQWISGGLILAILVAAVWSLLEVGPDFNQFDRAVDYAGRFLGRTVPFRWPPLEDAVWLSIVTLAITLCGTLLAAVISIPVAILAARNTAPFPGSRALGRALGVFSRALPDAFLVLILAMVITRGALPGILAIGIHSIGMISKLTADAIEQIDEGPRRALRATGATKTQEFWGAIWPQILPSFLATTLHRADINLRGSVILGIVGVPGLGYELGLAMRTLDYQRALPYAIILIVLCIGFEIVASLVRATLLNSEPKGWGIGARLGRARWARKRSVEQPTVAAETTPVSRKRPWTPQRVRNTSYVFAGFVIIVASIFVSSTMTAPFGDVLRNAVIAWNRLFPPSLDPAKWGATFDAFVETLQIGLAATLIALVVSLIIGPLAASNVAPTRGVRAGARLALVGIRGIPELLLAFFLIILTGLGPGAAVVALGVGGIGLLGKLYADSIEEIKPGPARAITTVGATRMQVFSASTFPQSAPALIGHTLYLFDSNVRAASILGIIGAGGIGTLMENASRLNQHEFSMLVILLFLVVLAIEAVSSLIRQLVK